MTLATKTMLIVAVLGSLVGGGFSALVIKSLPKTESDLVKEFYLVENAAHVSPHSLRQRMDKGDKDYILVDLRSPQEYEREHIIGAVSVPAYSDPDTSAYNEKDRIVRQFRELIEKNPGREIITYCYSIPCMTGRKVGKMLAENRIYVKTLITGWNEWRHFWTLWNHEHEWGKIKVEDYIWKGRDPGIPKQRELPSSCGKGEFSC